MKLIPNLLTVSRILLTPIFIYYAMRNEFLYALIIFVIAAVSDFLDGYLARHLGVVSKFGAILDPVADKVLIDCAYCTLSMLGYVPFVVSVVIILRDLIIVSAVLLCMVRKIPLQMRPSWASKVNTTIQLVHVIMVLIFYHASVQYLMDVLALVVLGSTLYSGAEYARQYSWVLQKLFRR